MKTVSVEIRNRESETGLMIACAHGSEDVVKIHISNQCNLEARCQFHQHFTCSFCAVIFAPKKYKPKALVQKKLLHKKAVCKMLMKLPTEMPKEKLLYFMQLKMDITRLLKDCLKRMLKLTQQLI